jgi:S-adenosylmethionine synthetase
MLEKVNPSHPDKVADRIAGAIVDLAYRKTENPKIAVEVLIGHGVCHVIAETSVSLDASDVISAVKRIAGKEIRLDYKEVPQDVHLAENQEKELKCGDNGIFKGVPTSAEEETLSGYVRVLYSKYPTDGKYILDEETDTFIGCQSNISDEEFDKATTGFAGRRILNPLGFWTGGTDVDTGATNRKLGSDMGRAVTGGGLHGKDLSKADVSVNIYAHLKAQETGEEVNLLCAIGDETVDGKPYSEIVKIAGDYVAKLGGFEKLAEWGLI